MYRLTKIKGTLNMNNPFERFYDEEIEIYKKTNGGYTNGDTKEYVGKIICDLQPYRVETEDSIRGLVTDKQYKIFADKYPILKVGNLVLFDGAWYRLTDVQEWTFGTSAIMRWISES